VSSEPRQRAPTRDRLGPHDLRRGRALTAQRQRQQRCGQSATHRTTGRPGRPRPAPAWQRAHAVQPSTARRAQLRGDRAWLANQPRQSTRTIFKVLATTKRVVKRPNDLYQHQEGTLGYRPEPKHAATFELDFTERTRQHGPAKLPNDSENTTPRARLQHEFTFRASGATS
jgi:hypothetical protein